MLVFGAVSVSSCPELLSRRQTGNHMLWLGVCCVFWFWAMADKYLVHNKQCGKYCGITAQMCQVHLVHCCRADGGYRLRHWWQQQAHQQQVWLHSTRHHTQSCAGAARKRAERSSWSGQQVQVSGTDDMGLLLAGNVH